VGAGAVATLAGLGAAVVATVTGAVARVAGLGVTVAATVTGLGAAVVATVAGAVDAPIDAMPGVAPPAVPKVVINALRSFASFEFFVFVPVESVEHNSFFCKAFTISLCDALVKPEAGGLSEYWTTPLASRHLYTSAWAALLVTAMAIAERVNAKVCVRSIDFGIVSIRWNIKKMWHFR